MRITLNLASRPFVELRPILARLRIIAGGLVFVALMLWLVLHSLEHKAALADANVTHWTHQTRDLEHEWTQDQAMMRQPENAATLEKSEFLNGIFAEKAFSWTAALMDLENVLPGGVQVISMQPQMAKDGHVTVRLQVTGERDKAVELVKNLETSKHFIHPRIAGESATQVSRGRPGFMPQISAGADVNFDILAEYNPRDMEAASHAVPVTKKTTSKKTSAKTASIRSGQQASPASRNREQGGRR